MQTDTMAAQMYEDVIKVWWILKTPLKDRTKKVNQRNNYIGYLEKTTQGEDVGWPNPRLTSGKGKNRSNGQRNLIKLH